MTDFRAVASISNAEMARAEAALEEERAVGHAVAARYDALSERLVVSIHNGVELAIPVRLIEGLANADPADIAKIEISPAGLGLHWPHLDADIFVPGLLSGVYGSPRWMAAQREPVG